MPHGGPHDNIYGNTTQAMEEATAAAGAINFLRPAGTVTPNAPLSRADLEAKYGNKYAGMEKQQPLSPEAQASLYRSYKPPTSSKTTTSTPLTGGYSSSNSANQFRVPKDLTETLEKLYAGLETTAQEELGSLETEDFSDRISELVEGGRLSA